MISSKKMTEAELRRTIDLSEEIVRPYIERIPRDGSDEMHDQITRLIMALGFGISVIAAQFLAVKDPRVFGSHIGTYVGETIPKLQELERKTKYGTTAKTKSDWDA